MSARKAAIWPDPLSHVECAPRFFCLIQALTQTKLRIIMEINPLLLALKDLSERTNVLRGYL